MREDLARLIWRHDSQAPGLARLPSHCQNGAVGSLEPAYIDAEHVKIAGTLLAAAALMEEPTMIEDLIAKARQLGASDLHLEPGIAPTLRVRGELQAYGDPLNAAAMAEAAQQLVGDAGWQQFQQRCSCDVARTVVGVRCRINVLRSSRGVGLAIRLLPAALPTLDELNLHSDLARLAGAEHGLILLSGPTGSGKSSTLAAMLEEINRTAARHIVTVEQPIEFALRPRQSFIRQREVGRDTPSFAQALHDCLREDPDVIMVGELRDPETIRLTLNAAETGHLVLATLHSASVVEALQRVVLAFAPEVQGSMAAQLADCLRAVICQRLRYREDLELRVPECEILTGSSGARALIRLQDFHKLASVLETSAADGMWSWERYRRWLAERQNWQRPRWEPASETEPLAELGQTSGATSPPFAAVIADQTTLEAEPGAETASTPARAAQRSQDVLVIDEEESDPATVLRELERRGRGR